MSPFFLYLLSGLKKLFFIFSLLSVSFVFSQQKGKDWYIIDKLNPSELSVQDKYLLDSLLPLYHKANHDTIRLRYVMFLANSLGDEHLWTAYNRIGLKMAEKGGNEKVYLINKSYALSNIGYEMSGIQGDYAGALKIYEECLKVQKELNDLTGIAASLNNIADIYKKQGDSEKAIEYHLKSLDVKEKNNDKLGVGISLLNLGFFYKNQCVFSAAVKCFSNALKIFESKKEKRHQASTLNNIAHIYQAEGDDEKAIQYFMQSHSLFEIVGEKQSCALSMANIGQVQEKKGNYDKAIECYYKAKKIRESIDDKPGISGVLVLISSAYLSKGNQDSALMNVNRAIDILKNLQNKVALSEAYQLASNIYYGRGDKAKAEDCSLKALELAKAVGYPYLVSHPAFTLYKINRIKNKNFALEMFELHIKMRDSLGRIENKKAILRQQFKSEYDKKSAADSLAQANVRMIEQNKHDDEIARQRLFTYGGVFGFILMLIIAFISFRAFKNKQHANKEITKQKIIIEEKQKAIVDSINYAKRIQYTLLAHEDFLNENLHEHCILFKPKDIVSGDFYWATKVSSEVQKPTNQKQETRNQELFYLAVCDSTGHGVPGAFMSLLNIGFLSEAINEKGIYSPNEIFNYVRKKLIESISKEEQKDGFDGTLVCFNKADNTITYASANNRVLLFNNQINELAYDKMPVGQGEKQSSFTLQTVNYKKGDILYLLTDGYSDQFGGPQGKKFKYKQFSDTLNQIASLPLHQQKEKLETAFSIWKGEQEQVDDVCVIGIRL